MDVFLFLSCSDRLYCTDPSVYSDISNVCTPKHTIAAMLYTSHSSSNELIYFIFLSLVWSKANMLNLFKAFQSDDGKACGIALGWNHILPPV